MERILKDMKLLITLFLAISTSLLFGQLTEPIQFTEKEYDFGTVKEEDGPIVHEFKFENNSADSISILNVKASCGCTTPGWTKEPVPPGESGFIKAQYNPKNRPGRFNKSLTIRTDYSETPIRLYIRGTVDPKPKSIEEELPTDLGGLRVKYKTFNMGRVYTREIPTVKNFEIYNSSDTSISFTRYESPEHIVVEFNPEKLKPKEKGTLKVIYKGDQIGTRRVDFLINDIVMLEIKAVIELADVHLAQAINYLEAYNLEIGLLINFGSKSLDFKRLVNKAFVTDA